MSDGREPVDFGWGSPPAREPGHQPAPGWNGGVPAPSSPGWNAGTTAPSSPGWNPGEAGYGNTTPAGMTTTFSPADSSSAGKPAVGLLIAPLVLAALAAVCAALLGDSSYVAWAAWFAAGPVAIGIVAWFFRHDTAQRARPLYVSPGWLTGLQIATFVVIAIGVGVSALRIALWVGHL